MANPSFEVADTTQGTADEWTQVASTATWGVGCFEDATSSWEPYEDFEETWRMPFYVHIIEDVLHTVGHADATDLPTALALEEELRQDLVLHLLDTDSHFSPDMENYALMRTIGQAITQAELITNVNVIKDALNDHFWNRSTIHYKWDNQNPVTSADASDLSTAITLLNEMKADYNAHLALVGYGDAVESAKLEFAVSDLEAGITDDFENEWAIADLFPLLVDQLVQVAMDDTAATWPPGHTEFLDEWTYIETELGYKLIAESGYQETTIPNPDI